MKKILTIIITTITFLLFSYALEAATTSTDRMSIINKNYHDINAKKHYTITAKFPTITNLNHSKDLNQLIKQQVMSIVSQYKNDFSQENIKPIEGLPLNIESNRLNITYKIFFSSRNLVSLRFAIDAMHYGAAHPLTVFQSFNYDVKRGKKIQLNDLFSDRHYLNRLSSISKTMLQQKLQASVNGPADLFEDGVKPDPKNFEVWNLTNKGLLITFDPYQVAAYVFGPQEIIIPYHNLSVRQEIEKLI